MKIATIIIILSLYFTGLSAQSSELQYNQQPVDALLSDLQSQSNLRIFYRPDDVAAIFISGSYLKDQPLQSIEKALQGYGLKIAAYRNWVFIHKDTLITAPVPEVMSIETAGNGPTRLRNIIAPTQVARSEYKIYEVGLPVLNANGTPQTNGAHLITGLVKNFKTGEVVPGASIFIPLTNTATTSDADGKYSINLPAGLYEMLVAGMGIKNTRRQIRVFSTGNIDIETEEEIFEIDEFTILSGKTNRLRETRLGVERFQLSEIKNIPSAFGEVDVLKAVLALPGVKSSGEVSTGFNVRGGSTDQNLILLNHSTIFNPTHLFGLLSAFNPDLVSEMEMYMSNIPAKHGGRIASVLEVNSRKADSEKWKGAASLGLLSSRLMLEGPIGDNTTLIAGARASHSDWMLSFIPENSGYGNGSAGFYDLNGSLHHRINEMNTVALHAYFSKDHFSFEPTERFGYQNLNISGEWRHFFTQRFFAKLIAGYDQYSNNIQNTENGATAFELSTRIAQYHAKADFDWYVHHAHSLNFGLHAVQLHLQPGNLQPHGEMSLVTPNTLQNDRALETAIYINDQWEVSPQLGISAGLRYSLYHLIGPRTYNTYQEGYLPSISTRVDTVNDVQKIVQRYHGPEFRLSARYNIASDLSVKAGINSMRQHMHKISNSTVMSPTDTWKLADQYLKPQTGIQYAAGIYKNFSGNLYTISAEVYYKTLDDYLDYRSGAQLVMNPHIETEVVSTEGQAYGVELSLKKTEGKLNGWISYTYARSFLRQSDPSISNPVNNGDWYPSDYDKPHDFKLVGNYRFTRRYSASLNTFYSTGRPVTLPVAKYRFAGGEYVYYSERNQYRIPDFFRMDASFNIEPSHKLTLLTHSTLSFGVYNLTGRNNVYSVYYKAEKGRLKGYQLSIFGAAIPYISYSIKF